MNAETLRSTTKKKVPRTAFHNHTGQYPDISQREPITVTKHGRPDITIVEAAYFERLAAGQILAVFDLNAADADQMHRSEARRVGNECVSPCRSRWSPYD